MSTNLFELFSDKYLMPVYFSDQLPQGSSIVSTLNSDHSYTLPASRTLCFPFTMRRYYSQVIIDIADITPFENCFVPSVRCWASTVAAGQSMTADPNSALATVNPGPNGATWNFWLTDQVKTKDIRLADINRAISNGTVYWMNVQNLQNKDSFFFLRFTFHGTDLIHVE